MPTGGSRAGAGDWEQGGQELQEDKPECLYMQNVIKIQVQCSKAREQNFQFWKLLTVVVDTHIKCVDKGISQHL